MRLRCPAAPSPVCRRAVQGALGAVLLALACLGTGAAPVQAQQEQDSAPPPPVGRLTLSAGIHYSEGKYGTANPTEVLYVPLSVRYDYKRAAASLTVPYIAIRGRGEPVSGGGVVFDPASSQQVSSSGLGDVVASVGYNAYQGTEPWPWVDVSAIAKFGTADPDKQLGTGKNDYGVQTDAYQRWGTWSWFATLGYREPGSPHHVQFNNVVYGSLGMSYPFTEALRGGLMWSGAEPLYDGADPQGDLIAFSAWTLSPAYLLQSYISHGLTHASADWAVGFTLSRSF